SCKDGIEGIDGNGVVCCPLGCGQCGGTGCSTAAGADNGLASDSCCGGGVKNSGNYCDDTGVAPCIYGSAPDDDDDDGDDDGDDDSGEGGDSEEDDDDESTCSNGLEGIDHKGEVCCPVRCGQCGGSGCSASGAEYGLGEESCCSSGVNDSVRYCDDTNEAPCII
ncbi:unnamed protein product, partial [Ectocarpus fasciculatus]